MVKDRKSGNNPSIQIIPPTKEENRYRYRLRAAGNDYRGYLTYELPRNSDHRTILLVNASHPFIASENQAEYDRLIQRISESIQRIAGAKNIVNRLAEGEFANLPNVRIAIHKYGPVPVYVLPQKFGIQHFGDDIEVQIGVYPHLKSLKSGSQISLLLPFLTTKAEFVRSLGIGLGPLFQRYLEDVGEAMYDIKHHLSLPGIFDRAKEIEAILAESIKTKLDSVMPTKLTFEHPQSEDEKLVKELFERESDWIFTARYSRQFALYFLNELYRIIGVESRSTSYLGGFQNIQTEFDALLGNGYVKAWRSELPLVATLSKTIRAYNDGDYDTIKEIVVHDEPLWVQRFVQFARFIAALHDEKLAPMAGRIFISYHHDVPVTEVLMGQIIDYIKSNFPNRVEVLSVKERGAGVKFKSPIRARIWLSDTIGGIVPRETEAISGGRVKDYVWIAREAEYGLLLGKRVIYLVETGMDEERMLYDLRNGEPSESLIPTNARVPEYLRKELIDSFTQHTRANFTVSTTDPTKQHLDPNIRDVIHAEAEKAIKRRHRDVLVGFYRQFPEGARRTLKHIQELVPYPTELPKQALIRKLVAKYRNTYADDKRAEKALTNAWNLAKHRALLINDRPMSLIRLLKKKNYTGNLREILKALRPDLNKAQILTWEKELLRAVVSQEDATSL